MNARPGAYDSRYLTDRDDLKESFVNTLREVLNELSEPEKNSKAIDKEVESLLTFIGATFSRWLFDNFEESKALVGQLWDDIYSPVISWYRDKLAEEKDENAERRFQRICKHISHYYKVFITRAIENYGCPLRLQYVVASLHLDPVPLPHGEPTVKASLLLSTVARSLYYMGALSGYRTESSLTGGADYSHAIMYYRVGSKILPCGPPLNELGRVHLKIKDYFSAMYYFVLSMTVRKPSPAGSRNFKAALNRVILRNEFQITQYQITNETEKDITEIKQILGDALRIYGSLYLRNLSKTNTEYGEAWEQTTTPIVEKIKKQMQSKTFPPRLLVKLSIISIVFPSLLDIDSGHSIASLRFALMIMDSMLSVALEIADNSEHGVLLADDQRIAPIIAVLLPSFRVYFDWIEKQNPYRKWPKLVSHNDLYSKMARLLEHFRNAYGFKFDVQSAVSRSLWDRLDDAIKQENMDDSTSNGEATSNEIKSKRVLMLQKQRQCLLSSNDEETQCAGLRVLGELVVPCGLMLDKRINTKTGNEAYRVQCILFSGVQLARQKDSLIELVEDEGETKFKYNMEKTATVGDELSSSGQSGILPREALLQNQKEQIAPTPVKMDIGDDSQPTPPPLDITMPGSPHNVSNGDNSSDEEEEILFVGRGLTPGI